MPSVKIEVGTSERADRLNKRLLALTDLFSDYVIVYRGPKQFEVVCNDAHHTADILVATEAIDPTLDTWETSE